MENLSHDFFTDGQTRQRGPNCSIVRLEWLRHCRRGPQLSRAPLKSQLCEARQAAKTVEGGGGVQQRTFSRVSVKNWSFKRLTMGTERIDRGFTFIQPSSATASPLLPSSFVAPFLFFSRFSAARDCRIVEGVRPFQTYPFPSRTPFNATKTNCPPRARSAKDEVDTTGERVPRCSSVFRLAFRAASRWFSRWCDWKIFTKTRPAGCILLSFFFFFLSSRRITSAYLLRFYGLERFNAKVIIPVYCTCIIHSRVRKTIGILEDWLKRKEIGKLNRPLNRLSNFKMPKFYET